MQERGRLLDPASQMDLRTLELMLQRLQHKAGDPTPALEMAPDEWQELERLTHALRARSAATRAASRRLRKQIMLQKLIDGDGRQSA